MSGESAQHIRLVERLVETVKSRYQTPQGIIILADHHTFGENQPPTVGGFKPDLFAQDLSATFRVIGEAKTANDLKDERSAKQIAAFLDHLSLYSNSSLYLAVPWLVKGKANNLIHGLVKSEHRCVTIRVLLFD
jgi:hypothetical protein